MPLRDQPSAHLDTATAEALAARLVRADPRLGATSLHPLVSVGHDEGPALAIEDHDWITLFEQRGNAMYSYRAMWFAADGDVVAVGARRSAGFEQYCRALLGLREVEVIGVDDRRARESLALRCAAHGPLLEAASSRARAAGRFNVVPYMGTGGVWRLAAAIAEHAGVPVSVAAPPPMLTRRVNDKSWFTACVDALLGGDAHPPAQAVFGSAVLALAVARRAARAARVVVKLPSSASAAGNCVLDASALRGSSLREVRERLLRDLHAAGWDGRYPLQVSDWEGPVVVSPSVQLWVPLPDTGPPLATGIFEQRSLGPASAFAGAEPSALPGRWRRRLLDEAGRIGALFQKLGYFGPCSLDAIIVGESLPQARLHWVECNGRFGGVSIPQLVANRLAGAGTPVPGFVIEERAGLGGGRRSFAEVLEALDDVLLEPGGDGGAVILSPTPIEDGTGYELLVVDRDVEAARRRGVQVAARIAGLLGAA